MTTGRSFRDRNGAWVAFAAALTLFVFSTCPVVYWGDSAELARRAVDLELSPIARGYPLHRLLTWAAGRLTGDPAFGSNFVSALFSAVSVALVYETARRLTRSAWAGATAAAAVGLGHTFWSYSVVAEVYSLHTALMMGAILCAIASDGGGVWPRRILGLLLGVALLHHRMIVFVGPGIVWWMWTGTERGRRLRAAADVLAGFAAGAIPFAVLCIAASRSPPPGVENTVGWWLEDVFLGGERNAGFLLGAGHKGLTESALYLLRWLVFNLPGPALLLAGVGFAVAPRRVALFLAILGLAHLWFPLRYDWTGDQYTFLIPLYPILALAAGLGVAWIAQRKGPVAAALSTGAVALFPVALYLALAFTSLGTKVLPGLTETAARAMFLPVRLVDRTSRTWCMERLTRLPEGARLHCDWGDGQVYLYLQRAENVRRDVTVELWVTTVQLGDGSGEEWLSVLPFTRHLPPPVAAVRDRLDPRGDGLFRVAAKPK